jgi:hypothetical protein
LAETKTWLTPKRIERGASAANDELVRWANEKWRRELTHAAKKTFRPAKVYGDTAAMRRDALASRQRGVGSALMASDAKTIGVSELLVAALALAGGFALGRYLMRRKRAAAATAVVHGAEEQNPYYVGAIALGAR